MRFDVYLLLHQGACFPVAGLYFCQQVLTKSDMIRVVLCKDCIPTAMQATGQAERDKSWILDYQLAKQGVVQVRQMWWQKEKWMDLVINDTVESEGFGV